jgi:hypothetical protein
MKKFPSLTSWLPSSRRAGTQRPLSSKTNTGDMSAGGVATATTKFATRSSIGKHRRTRGWRYRGDHFDKPLSVSYLVDACRPKPKEPEYIYLGTLEQPWRIYIPDPPDMTVGTITLTLAPEYPEFKALL